MTKQGVVNCRIETQQFKGRTLNNKHEPNRNKNTNTRHISEMKWNGIGIEQMKDMKAYVDESGEEDHATWNGEFAPR